jgi:hypothetical protein
MDSMQRLKRPENWLAVLLGPLLLAGCLQSTPTTASQAGKGGTQGSGVIHNVRQAAKRTADGAELKNFALAYYQFVAENGRGPASTDDLKGSLTTKMIEGLKDNAVYVAIWNIRNPTGSSVIAYAAEPDSFGTRLVAKGDGSVTRMNQEEFDKVKPK